MCVKTKTVNYLVYYSLISVIFNLQNSCDAEYNIIDVDDILSADYMPGSLLMLENSEENIKTLNNFTKLERFSVGKPFGYHHGHLESRENTSVGHGGVRAGIVSDGSIMGALNTMVFHRGKINEYLCRNFIAEQIIDDMSTNRIRKRASQGDKHKKNTTINPNHREFSLRENMIEDEGSSQYKSWLTKSTTLEDIYRHYQDVDRREDNDDEEEDNEDIEEEEQYDQHIAGYAYAPSYPVPSNHPLSIGPAKLGHSAPGMNYPSSVGYGYGPPSNGHAPVQPWHTGGNHGALHSVPSSHGYEYNGPPLTHHGFDDHVTVHHTEIHHESPKYSGGHESGGKDLSELFEIVLTALAYLSFGMFIVHVVMCISHAKEKKESVTIIVQATSTTGTVGTGMEMGMGMGMGMGGDEDDNGDDMGGGGNDESGNDGDGENVGGGDNGGGNNGDAGENESGNDGGGEDNGSDEGGVGDDGNEGGDGVDEGGGGDNSGDNGGGVDQNGEDGEGDNVGEDVDEDNDGGDGDVTGEGGDGSEGDQIRFPFITSTFNQRPTTKKHPTYYQSLPTQLPRPPTHLKLKKSKKNRKPKTSKKSKKSKKKRFKIKLKKSHKINDIAYTDAGSQFLWKNLGEGIGEAAPTGRSVRRRRRRRRRRRKRLIEEGDLPKSQMPTLLNPNLESLNELARHVLTSIEAALVAHQDDGACLRKVLCQNNRYSRNLENSNKMWIPVWSLGMSWLSGKLTKDVPRATSMLDMLKASVLGLGKANCEVIFQDCNLRVQRDKRRRRRRK